MFGYITLHSDDLLSNDNILGRIIILCFVCAHGYWWFLEEGSRLMSGLHSFVAHGKDVLYIVIIMSELGSVNKRNPRRWLPVDKKLS